MAGRSPALASGLILEVEGSTYGKMRQIGNVAWLSDDRAATQKTGPVKADLESLLKEPLRNNGHAGSGCWLGGVKVLDLTNVIAGPTIGSTLARFGAEVTSVQPVEPSLDPWNAVVFGLQAHRGKESLLLNLTTQKGQEVLQRLIAEVDVITINATDEQRDKLGLTPETLERINPRFILIQLDAYGGPLPGPKSNHLGHEIDISEATFRVVRHDQHPMGRWVDLVAPNAVRSKIGKVTMPDPMPKYGQVSVSILSRLGYSEAQVTEMLEENVVSQGWSEKYLPE